MIRKRKEMRQNIRLSISNPVNIVRPSAMIARTTLLQKLLRNSRNHSLVNHELFMLVVAHAQRRAEAGIVPVGCLPSIGRAHQLHAVCWAIRKACGDIRFPVLGGSARSASRSMLRNARLLRT